MKIYCFKAPKILRPLLKLIFKNSYTKVEDSFRL